MREVPSGAVSAPPLLSTRSNRRAAVLLALGAAAWLWWAGDPQRWSKALDARRFVVVFAAPFGRSEFSGSGNIRKA